MILVSNSTAAAAGAQTVHWFIDICAALLVLEAIVGLWGFALHTMGNLRGPSVLAFDNFIYGAPAMAPLLFSNLMILGIIGLWQLRNNEGYLKRANDQTRDFSRAR